MGALLFSTAAELFGRLRVLRWLLVILALGSLASAYAPSYTIFVVLRFFQGIGLGGESPVLATYMNELCPAKIRGRLIFVLQSTFAAGNLIAAIAAMWPIPAYGWQVMFLVGACRSSSPLFCRAPCRSRRAGSRLTPALAKRTSSSRRLSNQYRPSIREAVCTAHHRDACVSQKGIVSHAIPGGNPYAGGLVDGVLRQSGDVRHSRVVAVVVSDRLSPAVEPRAAIRHVKHDRDSDRHIDRLFLIDWLGRKRTFALAFLGAAIPMLYLAFSGMHVPAGRAGDRCLRRSASR